MSTIRKIIHSRLVVIWGITLVIIAICLAIVLLLIANSKRTVIQDAPPELPNQANPTDMLPSPKDVNIYLLESNGLELTPFRFELRLYTEPTEQLKQILSALIQTTPTNYRNPIPRGTVLNEVYIDTQKTAYLDFSHHLADGQIGGTTAEYMSVTAILRTVFDALPDDIKYIQILIDGKEVETLAGHINISQPLRF